MKVVITAKRITTYSTIVEMPAKEFKRLANALEDDYATSREAEKELNEKINVADWVDDELDEAEMEKFKP